jgi:UDPglucose 6-dehydrogenase
VRAFDPRADLGELEGELPFEPCDDALATADGVDALVVVTAWPEFRDLDLVALGERVRRADLVDTQNLFDPAAAVAAGWDYYGVGRRSAGLPSAGAEARVGT